MRTRIPLVRPRGLRCSRDGSRFARASARNSRGATSPQLQASEFTLPDAFAANPGLGYSLGMFGKWHLNSGAGTDDTPRTIGGWPHFAGTIIGALPDYSAWTKITNNVAVATTTYATTDTANDVIGWINSRTGPWFAWAAFNAPHAPLHFPPNDLHSYDAAATTRNYYEAMCEALDTEVGRVLANVNLATTAMIAGPFKTDSAGPLSMNSGTGDVTLMWSGVEGGIYRIEATDDLTTPWSIIAPSVTVAGDDIGGIVEGGGATGRAKRLYRTVRTGVSAYDNAGFAGTHFTTVGSVGGGLTRCSQTAALGAKW